MEFSSDSVLDPDWVSDRLNDELAERVEDEVNVMVPTVWVIELVPDKKDSVVVTVPVGVSRMLSVRVGSKVPVSVADRLQVRVISSEKVLVIVKVSDRDEVRWVTVGVRLGVCRDLLAVKECEELHSSVSVEDWKVDVME